MDSLSLRRRAKFLRSMSQRRTDETADMLDAAADQIDRMYRALEAAKQFQIGDEVTIAIEAELIK